MKFSNFIDLKSRMPIAILLMFIVAGLIFFAHLAIVQMILVIIFGLVAIIGLWEFTNLLKIKNIYIPWTMLATVAVVWLCFLYISLFYTGIYFVPGLVLVIAAIALFAFYFNKIENSIVHLACSCFGFLYIVVPLGLMLKILYPYASQDGRIWLAYLICTTKATDVGAYFIGKMFGTKRLAAQLSPAKTVEGAIGGLVFACLTSLAFYLLSMFLPQELFHFNFLKAILFGGLIGIIGQIGDLTESLMKRDAHMKDSNTLPGIGGMLDLLDSLLLTTPVVYLLMKIL
ncbi:MAG: phosphatidate cytidylyltransferase [Chlamydiales bacterium]|nr:phosphatidate cytidylyltransferase [Chlamydiales bacterium]